MLGEEGGKKDLLRVALRYRMYKAIEQQREREREKETISVGEEGKRRRFKGQGVNFPVAVKIQHPSA